MMKKKEWMIYNYCVAFIDLLGQRDGYKDEGFLPQFTSEGEMETFNQKIRSTIGAIFSLQKGAETLMESALTPNIELKNTLAPKQYETYDDMSKTKIKSQRWSDGLVFFTSLGDPDIKCPVVGLFALFGLAGSLCFLGLNRKQPIRGAIDIAWGVELHDSELYGAAVAKAYELEGVAQYPRIVVSDRTICYLKDHQKVIDEDLYSRCNRQFAEICLNMLMEDVDGHFFIHYLGDFFKEKISQKRHGELYKGAIKYIQEQLVIHGRAKENKESNKLSFRYSHLLSYFMMHSLKE